LQTSTGYGSLLEELGYRPLTEPEKIISDAMKRSLATLGESFSKTLLQHLSSTYDLSEDEILKEITVIENELREILHGGANVILERVKEEIYNYIRSKNRSEAVNRYLIHIARRTEKYEDPSLHTNVSSTSNSATKVSTPPIDAHAWKMMLSEVITEVLAVEAFEFIRQVPAGEHLALIYNKDITRDSLITEFLSPPHTDDAADIPQSCGLISARPTRLRAVRNMLCQDLVSPVINKSTPPEAGSNSNSDVNPLIKKLADWIVSLQSAEDNNPSGLDQNSRKRVRIAAENTWFFENNLDNQMLTLEKSLGYSGQDNGSRSNNPATFCTYDTSKLTEAQVRSLAELHNYIILDDPLMIYKKAEPRTS
jgi:hypothetical protein